MLVLTVGAVILATAAAAALLGGNHSDRTPHGRLMGTLQQVADAQETHHGEAGRFASWVGPLDLRVPTGVELVRVRGTADRWEAVVRATDARLVCSQTGSRVDGRTVRERAACYTVGE